MPQVTCGECYFCRHGRYHICDHLKVMGFQTGGTAQEYFPVRADKVLKLPEAITLNQGAMVEDGSFVEGREAMAWADTLAGLCITNAGVTLPHGIGMTISGQRPRIMHGESLAVTYPEFTRFTYPYAIHQFAQMGCIFNPALEKESDETAAKLSCEALDSFMQKIGMWLSLEGLGASEEDVVAIADNSQVLPDYKNNPRIATRDDIFQILMNSYRRK